MTKIIYIEVHLYYHVSVWAVVSQSGNAICNYCVTIDVAVMVILIFFMFGLVLIVKEFLKRYLL